LPPPGGHQGVIAHARAHASRDSTRKFFWQPLPTGCASGGDVDEVWGMCAGAMGRESTHASGGGLPRAADDDCIHQVEPAGGDGRPETHTPHNWGGIPYCQNRRNRRDGSRRPERLRRRLSLLLAGTVPRVRDLKRYSTESPGLEAAADLHRNICQHRLADWSIYRP
jgi:hypothetical protein